MKCLTCGNDTGSASKAVCAACERVVRSARRGKATLITPPVPPGTKIIESPKVPLTPAEEQAKALEHRRALALKQKQDKKKGGGEGESK